MLRLLPSNRALVIFASAATHSSFTRAAEELHLTQGAVSQQIRLLEQQLGVKLFERVRQRVLLTNAGRQYLSDIEIYLGKLRESTRQIMAAGDSVALNIGVVAGFTAKWLMPRISHFYDNNPNISINFLSKSDSDFNLEEIDAAILHGQNHWPGASSILIAEERLVAVSSRQFKQRHQISHPGDLLHVRLLQRFSRPDVWDQWFQTNGIDSDLAFRGQRFNHFDLMTEAAKAGVGVALLPKILIEQELKRDELIVLFDTEIDTSSGFYFVFHNKNRDNQRIHTFMKWLQLL
ncbi:hypothetical protein N182_37560 [Sinorhizobium sp. GL2]|nr:hypothetical protein N182_37560 [Sinorhizobium sp. GL2]